MENGVRNQLGGMASEMAQRMDRFMYERYQQALVISNTNFNSLNYTGTRSFSYFIFHFSCIISRYFLWLGRNAASAGPVCRLLSSVFVVWICGGERHSVCSSSRYDNADCGRIITHVHRLARKCECGNSPLV